MRRSEPVFRLMFVPVAILLLSLTAGAQNEVDLSQLLQRMAQYVAQYGAKVSGVSLEEEYQLMDVTGGKMQSVSRISSDVVLVRTSQGLAGLRDPFAIDKKALRPREPRIVALLAAPATPTMRDWTVAASFPQESAHFFVLDVILKANDPVTALRFADASLQPVLTFKLDGRKTVNKVPLIGVRFEEPAGQEKTYLIGTRNNARAAGRFWVAPEDGSIHQAELWLDSKGESANISVKFARHPELGVLLPSETTETYEEREGATGPRTMGRTVESGRSGTRVSFQASAKYSNVRYAPIDLTRLK